MDNYNIISTLNEAHKIYLVQHSNSHHIYIQKVLDVYNLNVYKNLYRNPIAGIPQLINYYEKENQLIVIEEYISGVSLQEKIDNSELSIADIRNYMIMLCNILESLHSMKPPIIHRDIKPSNIIVTSYNYVFLLDFNAAKQFFDYSNTDTVLLGTPGYAAPEQYGFGSSSPQTDIYSLGIVLKEMVDSLSSTTHEFDDIINKCTHMEPSLRYDSVADIHDALILHSASDTTYIPTRKLSAYSYMPPGFRSKTSWKMLVATFAYLFVIYFSVSITFENTYGAKLWLERVFILIMCLSIIFNGFNYLNMQNMMPLCKSKYKVIHYAGIVLLDFIIILSLFVLMFILESIIFIS